MTEVSSRHSETQKLLHGLKVQTRVIGALIMRELHTRFGRDNIGFLWLIVEPALLTIGVSILHFTSGPFIHYGMPTGSFMISGYTCYILFRSIINRASDAIESNRTLLYHRMITIFDVLFSRAVLELASTILAIVVLSIMMQAVDYGFLPQRPLIMLIGLVILFWFSFGLSMIIAAASERSTLVERLVHPATYLSMPISGAFSIQQTMPDPFRWYLSWWPTTEAFELIREGQFQDYTSDYTFPVYVVGWCMILSVIGLIYLRAVRKDVHLG
ncbi:ABC transporter permease [Komagataeibacter sp. FNDCR2]|uniref:ABC transporter permease n=1 Tax=Komagataeibacter sp. FNDCR2 TaxID=2878682 RepID=UPI001E3B5410|nr:ABC transporter permease [Komagataeibacter sp. FNDCR2]MCE2575619.1 ABC transporter permease [Komagataeibacter sp. FNDCR2]